MISCWARSSAWIEQHPSKVMVAGSNPVGPGCVVYMEANKEFDAKIVQIKQQIDILLNDNSVPRNVKSALSDARKALDQPEAGYSVRSSAATYKIDEISNDINLPPYARTVVWNLLSDLESIKE